MAKKTFGYWTRSIASTRRYVTPMIESGRATCSVSMDEFTIEIPQSAELLVKQFLSRLATHLAALKRWPWSRLPGDVSHFYRFDHSQQQEIVGGSP